MPIVQHWPSCGHASVPTCFECYFQRGKALAARDVEIERLKNEILSGSNAYARDYLAETSAIMKAKNARIAALEWVSEAAQRVNDEGTSDDFCDLDEALGNLKQLNKGGSP